VSGNIRIIASPKKKTNNFFLFGVQSVVLFSVKT